MAQLTLPSAVEVWEKAKATLNFTHFNGKASDSDVIEMIAGAILPSIERQLNVLADDAASPNDFPFDADFLVELLPNWNEARIEVELEQQEGDIQETAMWGALWQLFDRVRSDNPFYATKSKEYKKYFDEGKERVKVRIEKFASLSNDTQEEDALSKPRSHSVTMRPRFGW